MYCFTKKPIINRSLAKIFLYIAICGHFIFISISIYSMNEKLDMRYQQISNLPPPPTTDETSDQTIAGEKKTILGMEIQSFLT